MPVERLHRFFTEAGYYVGILEIINHIMQRFLVVYLAPIEGIEEWMKIDPEMRKAEEEKMKAQWDQWMEKHKGSFIEETKAVGKTKRITKDGVSDTKNNMMLYSIVEAESHDAAATLFVDHPHFGIPDATIEIMPATSLSEMMS
jgi:hypothetical protein